MVLKKVKKGFIGAGLVAVLGMSLVTGVSANEHTTKVNDVNLTVESSTVGNNGLLLETPEIRDFGAIELMSTPQKYTTGFEGKVKITDLRGTHDGWALSVGATPFENENNHQLPKGSLTLDGVSLVERAAEGIGEIPRPALTKTTAIDNGNVLVINALEGKGAGVFDVSFASDALELTVDATTAEVGAYTSTLTWNLQSTPNAS